MPLALFDFDGTLTQSDSLIQFIRFTKGNFRFLTGMFFNFPTLLALKAGVISNQKAKEIIFTYFFKGTKNKDLLRLGEQFSKKIIPGLIRSEAKQTLSRFQSEQIRIVIVSASFYFWLKDWCLDNNFDLIATEHETIDGLVTGKIKGRNCHGIEKARRIRNSYNLSEHRPVYAYGDSQADRAMLNLADYKWMKWKPQ
ncbi:HAD family hydrolase [Mangrovibacterium lignilyticum]|uniref:HAD family hydrolase n=1 Tax=Mangrovibacterium lignilyticum TaxID=2668052 RepID=UPI0013D11C2E|nr:HAD family hydrolase [Mangrovibacterium lignilyticum]